jgi:hypothetical protein
MIVPVVTETTGLLGILGRIQYTSGTNNGKGFGANPRQ